MDFDRLAAQWDESPVRRQLTRAIADAIRNSVVLDDSMRALEIGCGTGTLALALARDLAHIRATDASAGMIAELRAKLDRAQIRNITPEYVDLLTGPTPDEVFDLCYAAMALHHIDDVPRLLSTMAALTRSGGVLAVADLCEEDGSFHAPETVPHNGFSETRIRGLLDVAGFRVQSYALVHTICKGGDARYPVFMVIAER